MMINKDLSYDVVSKKEWSIVITVDYDGKSYWVKYKLSSFSNLESCLDTAFEAIRMTVL